ncbi:MAG: YkgJ family cysteine cluster protein [Lentisphaerae bacterium]|nr:YkgJ family cysteine cluster protein [Lentisphaerota bacterium]
MKTFTCWQCGHCCRVPGYVHVTDADLEALARHRACSVAEFTERYTALTRDRRGLTLREETDGACVFLNADGGCAVYEARPQQCRDFPYTWNYPGWEQQCENTCALPGKR